MSRIRLQLPKEYNFTCEIPVRITDLNYGGHAGNDTILSLIHEARMQYLLSLGYTEMNMEGIGMIMADAALEFKRELFYPETILVSIAADGISKIGFDLYYKMESKAGNDKSSILIATAKTGMICYDYGKKKIVSLPEAAMKKLQAL